MHLNKGFFADNGNCGYLLKPYFLTNDTNFDPTNKETLKNSPKKLFIKIISGQNLPINLHVIPDYSDPFVTISIHGLPCDYEKSRTKTIKNNGFNPVWNESFEFTVYCPELAIVRFKVLDEDPSSNHSIGHYEIRFKCLQQGYRHLKLINKNDQGTLFLFVKINDLIN